MVSISEVVTLGDRSFELRPMPWKQLRRLAAKIRTLGMALAAGVADESTMADMADVLSIGLDLPLDELDALRTDWHEVSNAFRALMRVSGMERELEHALGEARRRGLLPPAPASIPGTPSMPGSTSPPAGPGTSSTT